MNNKTIFFAIGILILLAGGFIFVNNDRVTNKINSKKGGVILGDTGNMQKIVLGAKELNYYPDTIKVKVNQPVEITLDESVSGCLRSFSIRELGILQYAQTPNDKIVFTPTEKGSFTFSCSMGMGSGTLIVE